MIIAAAILTLLFSLATALIAGSWVMALRLTLPSKRRQLSRWLLSWLLKGLALPAFAWVIMNLGLSWNFPPFMPQVQAAQNHGGDWAPEFLEAVGAGLFILSSYWTAATLGWVLWAAYRAMRPEPRKDFKSVCRTSFLAIIIPVLLMLMLGGWTTLGLAVTSFLAIVVGSEPKLMEAKKLPPQYARAIARLKFGKYVDAEQEIIRQLEAHHDDFEGWLMLAGLYANHFNDLPEAQRTVLEICQQPDLPPDQLSLALHRLADWHLKLGQDPDAARRALLLICDRLAGSQLAQTARLRINQLPQAPEELRRHSKSTVSTLPCLPNVAAPGDTPKGPRAAPPAVGRNNDRSQ